MQSSDGEFECSVIAGRKFESINDHAAYLRVGGCARIIEALAACSRFKGCRFRRSDLSAVGCQD